MQQRGELHEGRMYAAFHSQPETFSLQSNHISSQLGSARGKNAEEISFSQSSPSSHSGSQPSGDADGKRLPCVDCAAATRMAPTAIFCLAVGGPFVRGVEAPSQ